MSRVTWTRAGEADLEEIILFIDEQAGRRSVAQEIYFEIVEKCRLYAKEPMLGQAYPELGENYRGFVHKRWLVVYQARGYGIEVFAVLDTSRDFASYFQRRMAT